MVAVATSLTEQSAEAAWIAAVAAVPGCFPPDKDALIAAEAAAALAYAQSVGGECLRIHLEMLETLRLRRVGFSAAEKERLLRQHRCADSDLDAADRRFAESGGGSLRRSASGAGMTPEAYCEDFVADWFVARVQDHPHCMDRCMVELVEHDRDWQDYLLAMVEYHHARRRARAEASDRRPMALRSGWNGRFVTGRTAERALIVRGPDLTNQDPAVRRAHWRKADARSVLLRICEEDLARAGQKLLDAEEDGEHDLIRRWSTIIKGLWNKHSKLLRRVSAPGR